MIKKIQNGVLLALMLVAMVTSSAFAAPWWEEAGISATPTNGENLGSVRIYENNIQIHSGTNWVAGKNPGWYNVTPAINITTAEPVLNCSLMSLQSILNPLRHTLKGIVKICVSNKVH